MRLPWNNPRGSITLVALCLVAVIGISLASYLALCQQSLLLSTRTIQLNKARQLAETGLEEALWSLNTAANPSTTISAMAWSNATWTTSGLDKTCTIAGYALGNGATGQITIKIENFNGPTTTPAVSNPIITTTATVSLPNLGDFTKTLTATTKPAPLFANAIGVVKGQLDLYGGTTIDSWDSDYDPAAVSPTPNRDYNTATAAVLYSSVAHPPASTSPGTYAAIIAAPNITLNSAAVIYGYVATLGNPINVSTGWLIKGPLTPPLTNIDQARVSKSAFLPSFPVQAPAPIAPAVWYDLPSNASWGSSQTIGAATTQYYRSVTDESLMTTPNGGGNDLFLNGSKKLIIDGPVVLVVNEDFELSGSAEIVINPPNGRLEIYVRDDVLISNTAGFNNLTNEPKNLALFCTSEYSSNFSFRNSSSQKFFNGVLFSADDNEIIKFDYDLVVHGAILAGYTPRFSAGGFTTIHYDTALQYLPKGWFKGVTTPFMITRLTETP